MPRSVLPKRLGLQVRPVILDAAVKTDIASTLGLDDLSPLIERVMSENIQCIMATVAGSESTTVANNRLLLESLKTDGPKYEKAVRMLAATNTTIDDLTHTRLHSLAISVLQNQPDAKKRLIEAVDIRLQELSRHPIIKPSAETLRFHCGILRVLFSQIADPSVLKTPKVADRHLRKFVNAVLGFALTNVVDFSTHADRFDEYLKTDVMTNIDW